MTSVAAELGVQPVHLYESSVRGYSALMTPSDAARIAADPRVKLVQPDGVVTTTAQTLPTASTARRPT
nr:hypothetical protein GCM10017745_44240 [Saccharothrix mutabilis subsp. capreolus]